MAVPRAIGRPGHQRDRLGPVRLRDRRQAVRRVGPGGAVLLRLVHGERRPADRLATAPLRGLGRRDLLLAGTFGLVLAGMNLSFYQRAAPDPARHRRDDRVPRPAGGRGGRLTPADRPALGGARGGRDPRADARRRRPRPRRARGGLRSDRRGVCGPPTSCSTRGSAGSSRAAAASRWRCASARWPHCRPG